MIKSETEMESILYLGGLCRRKKIANFKTEKNLFTSKEKLRET